MSALRAGAGKTAMERAVKMLEVIQPRRELNLQLTDN